MMLMPPQPPIKSSPDGGLDPNYGFIFNDQQKPKKRFPFSLPGGSNLTKITLLIVIGAATLGALIIALSSFFGGNGVNTKQINDVIARAQEISRVSDLVNQQSRDVATLNLASTVSASLTSDQVKLISYLNKTAHKKITTKDLNLYLNKKTDAQIQIANSTNSLSSAYYSYLKDQLAAYENSAKAASQDNPSSAQPLLQTAFDNAKTILSTQQIASGSN
jgi:hypothetical protein